MGAKYFGTDGIRGRVGEGAMSADFVLKLGWAAGRVLAAQGGKVIIGKDTRVSGYMYESALEAGLAAAGMSVRLVGPMPTPAIAYLTRTFRAQAGIMISASHNPYYDNGVKFFGADGRKLSNDIELAIEAELDKPFSTVSPEKVGRASRIDDARGRYIEFCKRTVPGELRLTGMKIVVDCAHGSTYHIAPYVFKELGATVIKLGHKPDGFNINKNVGAMHPEVISAAVLEHGADLGVSLDGDGDRVMMCDSQGNVLDGDDIMYIIALDRYFQQRLEGPVVGTVMTNLGTEKALGDMGIPFVRANVGDRYVMEELNKYGGIIGGETSGHVLCLDRTTTGDGTISALQVLAAMYQQQKSLADVLQDVKKYPQIMINVPVKQRFDLDARQDVVQAMGQVEQELNGSGRVVLRPSGTEPVVRVMVEADERDKAQRYADRLSAVVAAA